VSIFHKTHQTEPEQTRTVIQITKGYHSFHNTYYLPWTV